MSGRKESIRNGIDRSSKSKARPPESELNARTDEIRSALDKHGPLHCRAVVPAYAAKDFHNGCYPPWYVAHVDQTWSATRRSPGSRTPTPKTRATCSIRQMG